MPYYRIGDYHPMVPSDLSSEQLRSDLRAIEQSDLRQYTTTLEQSLAKLKTEAHTKLPTVRSQQRIQLELRLNKTLGRLE
jgi:hypothetical protein